jgi:hypothetical protein
LSEEEGAGLGQVKESMPRIIKELLKFVELAQEYSSMYGELRALLGVRAKLIGPTQGPFFDISFRPKGSRNFCEFYFDPYPRFEPRGTLKEVRLNLSEGAAKIEIRYGSSSCEKYDLSDLSVLELIELAYNLRGMIDEMVAELERWKSELSGALDVVRSIVAQVRLLTEPVQQ